MQELWQKLNETTDLFAYWHNELKIRQEFRNNFTIDHTIILETREQIEFLYRSLYLTGRPADFFGALIPNLDKSPALNWLKAANPEIIRAFLEFMPKYIRDYKPGIEQLLFLVHLYNQELDHFFTPIISILTASQCQFISHKTANQDFRKLLKKRLAEIEKEQRKIFYGLDLTKNSLTYPTPQGDKVKLLIDTVNLLHKNQAIYNNSPSETEAGANLLPVVSSLFELGLIEDCLHLLLFIYNNYPGNNQSLTLNPDEKAIKTFNKLVLKTISMYALLNQSAPFHFAVQMYSRHFPDLNYDRASLNYLKLYEKMQVTSSSFTTTILDLYPEVLKIRQMRADEVPLLFDYEITDRLSGNRFLEICRLAQDKLAALPHETFITLELLRNLLKHGWVKESIAKDILAENYLSLFRWLPSSLIINETLITDLITNTSPAVREQLEKILKLTTYYNNNSILVDIKEKPDLFKLKNEELRRVILTGKFLGVLK